MHIFELLQIVIHLAYSFGDNFRGLNLGVDIFLDFYKIGGGGS